MKSFLNGNDCLQLYFQYIVTLNPYKYCSVHKCIHLFESDRMKLDQGFEIYNVIN